ncbi:MAG: peptide-methionine (R)-S-oxide reductase, partial [Rhodobacteraceae bacterium]|nr:peptide-methionine (R)-S-oxide reductase [Paracoccaceae bacterium]
MPLYEKTRDAIDRLEPEEFRVTQQNGTEAPGTGKYLDNKEP